MKYHKFMVYRLLIVIALALVVSSFVGAGNFVFPLIAIILAMLAMFFLRKRVDKVLTDERVEYLAGRAARLTFSISAFAMAIVGLVLISLKDSHPQYYLLGLSLAYLSAGMLFLYSILFKIFSRKI